MPKCMPFHFYMLKDSQLSHENQFLYIFIDFAGSGDAFESCDMNDYLRLPSKTAAILGTEQTFNLLFQTFFNGF